MGPFGPTRKGQCSSKYTFVYILLIGVNKQKKCLYVYNDKLENCLKCEGDTDSLII